MANILPPSDENVLFTGIEAAPQGLPDGSAGGGAPTATPDEGDDDLIAKLASMSPLEYERVRAEYAKRMGCRPGVLDGLVKATRDEKTEDDLPFPKVEPFPEPIDPAKLLDDVACTILRFIVVDPEQADAAALWVAFTWFINEVEVAPLAIINAPEKACGKSQLLDVLGRMAARPLPAANSSTAFLFRAVEQWTPTILIDEADTFIRDNDEIKGLINAGYTRANAFVGRVVGNDFEPKLFRVWGAKALAGIALERHLPDATMSRAIVFELRRKLPHESVTRLRHAEAGLFEGIASKLARFALDYSQQVRLAQPDLPDVLGDRAQDNWEPLLAIAGCAGPDWVRRATAAALKLSSSGKTSASTGNELLADIEGVFESKGVFKISTADLIKALVDDDEKPWATYNRGKPLSPRQLARQLAGYDIKSKTVRFGYSTPKGFESSQFADAFARYLASPTELPELPQQRNDMPESNNGEAGGVSGEMQHSSHDAAGTVADNPQQNLVRNAPATGAAMPALESGGVADKASPLDAIWDAVTCLPSPPRPSANPATVEQPDDDAF